ncbi:MAG: Membrane protein oxaA [Gemmatimonadetes bacterium]|nr:Membrane protein oxaA [Gemmatimonadota bacterium]
MDRRTLIALVLVALVLIGTPILFPSARRGAAPTIDSATRTTAPVAASNASATPGSAAPATAALPQPSAPTPQRPTIAPANELSRNQPTPAESTVVVTTPNAQFALMNPGAVPAAVKITNYRDLRPGRKDTMVVAQPRGPLLHYRLALGADTIALDTVPFTVRQSGSTTTFSATTPPITITYAPETGYRMSVRGTVANAPPGSALIVDLPNELRSAEADTLDDQRHLAYGYKAPLRDVQSIPFGKLDSTTVRADTGAMQWVAARNKYWLVALMQPVGEKPAGAFRGLTMRGGTKVGRVTRSGYATTVQPLNNGQFAFDLYAGPQSWQELHTLGNELENVNPYAGFLHAVVQPFATIVMRTLLWMKATFHVNYGWVLVLFGVTIRLLLWPLNQKAMRTSIAMQRLQPELTEIQKRYKNEPDKQRDALVKIYAAHGMSPLSPMLGCLPMLLPMPVLFALYFVFQNTIEFRGVHFLWLPDLALRDPFYIIPVLMGASMFLLSWIGMRAMPPNPQTKMMSYMMPVMFTVMFLNFASGLNLYYAVQNIAALPQQWLLTRERAKAAAAAPANAAARKT